MVDTLSSDVVVLEQREPCQHGAVPANERQGVVLYVTVVDGQRHKRRAVLNAVAANSAPLSHILILRGCHGCVSVNLEGVKAGAPNKYIRR